MPQVECIMILLRKLYVSLSLARSFACLRGNFSMSVHAGGKIIDKHHLTFTIAARKKNEGERKTKDTHTLYNSSH